MIIVSQNKKRITESMELFIDTIIRDNEPVVYGIYADKSNSYLNLGIYKTEERAKEVLNSVTAMYQANELMKATKSDITQEQMVSQFLNKKTIPFKYEMTES